MSKALAIPEPPATVRLPEGPTLSAETLENVMLNGDLSKLTARQRLEWIHARCEAAGLDPRCQPFQYLTLQGKLILYATKAATENLVGIHKLRVEITDRSMSVELGIASVMCRVTFPDGRSVENLGVVSIAGLKGEPLANALMKTVTKAQRRTVLAACGLGMLDETEIESIEVEYRKTPPPPSNGSGHGRLEAYASPEQVEAFERDIRNFVEEKNAAWLDYWTGNDGEVPDGIGELLNGWQVARHLLKVAKARGILNVPEDQHLKSRQVNQIVAVWHARDPEAVADEANDYFESKSEEVRVQWHQDHPEPGADG